MARPSPVPIIVTATSELGPRAVRIAFSGNLRVESDRPASSMSLWFSDPGAAGFEQRRGRSDKRTFTPRTIATDGTSMTVDFVLHGSGPAATWASAAVPGDRIWCGHIKGGYRIPGRGAHIVLIGDDTAIPAIGTILEALAPGTRATAIVEVVDHQDERSISDGIEIDPIWIHRGDDPGQTGMLTVNLIDTLEVPDGSFWWVGGEREAVRAIRDKLVTDHGVPKDHMNLNAHWRLLGVDPRRR